MSHPTTAEWSTEAKERLSWRKNLKLWTCYSCCFALGWHDAAASALLPSIQSEYDVGFRTVSLLFVAGFIGAFTAAFVNVPLTKAFNFGQAFAISALCLACTYIFVLVDSHFALMVIGYSVAGLASALLETRMNNFISIQQNARMKLGLLHAIYGIGALGSPLAATAFVLSSRVWRTFFWTSLALGIFNVLQVVFAFRLQDELELQSTDQPSSNIEPCETPSTELSKGSEPDLETATKNTEERRLALQQHLGHVSIWAAVKIRAVSVLSALVICSTGIEIAQSGWILTYLLEERNGPPSAGYVSTGFFAGVTISRIASVPITMKIGEKNVIYCYLPIAIGLQFIIWFVDNLVANAVAVALVGFCIGPIFPNTISMFSRLVPRNAHAAAMGLMSCCSRAGVAGFPFLVGLLAQENSIRVLPPVIIAIFVTMLCICLLIPNEKTVMAGQPGTDTSTTAAREEKVKIVEKGGQ